MGKSAKSSARCCEVCNVTFYKPPSHLAKWPAKTCSRSCAAVLKSNKVSKDCQHCGEQFSARPSRVKNGFDKYCSKACDAAAALKRIAVQCRWCSKDMSITPHISQTRKKHFCCRECSMSWLKRFGTRKGVDAFHSRLREQWIEDQCCRCGATENLELDHKVPRFAGGKATKDNAQTLCRKCNREKFWNEDLQKFAPDLSRD